MALTKLTKNLIDGNFGTEWVSTIQTSNFTAEAAKGYFVNTTSQVLYVTLPVGVVGAEIVIQDYAGTFATNKVILTANGSEKIQGESDDSKCAIKNATVTLIYQDATRGWTASNIELNTTTLTVDYLIVAGGASGGAAGGGAGGAGGLRTSYGTTSGGNVSSETSLSLVTGTNYPITIGAGGAGVSHPNGGNNGNNSLFSTITSLGGGAGGYGTVNGGNGGNGGSGGGANGSNSTGGNALTPTQGFKGGDKPVAGGGPTYATAGGGGAGAAAANVTSQIDGSSTAGGVGLNVLILNYANAGTASVGEQNGGNAVYYAGGGGGSQESGSTFAAGGLGGGTAGAIGCPGTAPAAGTPNTGGGSGGTGGCGTAFSNAGGSGVVIIRYPNNLTVSGLAQASGSPFTEGTDKVSVFTSGTGNIQFN